MHPQELSAQELVQLCIDHNQKAAWEEFVRRYRPTIARVVSRSIRHWTIPTPALMDDLIQDTYAKLFDNDFRALRDFQFVHENSVFGFLKTVASNVVMDYFRSVHSQKRGSGQEDVSLEDAEIFIPASRNNTQHADWEIMIHEINECLKSQSSEPHFERDYCIFWLYFRHGLTAKAISNLPSIQLTVKGVESTLLRLTKLVRSRLSRAAGH